MNYSLRQLRIFVTVAHARSFSRAGETIGLSQSAVSHSVKELENQTGVKLLDRTTREVVLTEAGQQEIGTLPTNRKVFDARLQDLMTVEYLTNSDGSPLLDANGLPVQKSLVSWFDEDGTEKWYDLRGRRIEKPTKAGLYIRNGEKIVVNDNNK